MRLQSAEAVKAFEACQLMGDGDAAPTAVLFVSEPPPGDHGRRRARPPSWCGTPLKDTVLRTPISATVAMFRSTTLNCCWRSAIGCKRGSRQALARDEVLHHARPLDRIGKARGEHGVEETPSRCWCAGRSSSSLGRGLDRARRERCSRRTRGVRWSNAESPARCRRSGAPRSRRAACAAKAAIWASTP